MITGTDVADSRAADRAADRAAVREAVLLLREIDPEDYDARMCGVIRLGRSALDVLSTELARLQDDEEDEQEAAP